MDADRRFLGRLVVVLAVFAMAGPTLSSAANFQADLDWLYYHDGLNRTLSWDLSAGTANANGEVTIPTGFYSVPPAEAGMVLTLEPGQGLATKTFGSGVYRMAIPQATPGMPAIPTAATAITVDGSPADWSGISVFVQDQTGDAFWPGTPTGADVDWVKLAYSPDQTKLYILYKLTENANTSLWYRLLLNKNLGWEESGVGVFQIDLQYGSGQWQVVSQGYTSDSWDSWYEVTDNGVAAVSGMYLEAQVDTAPFGLPARASVEGRTMVGSGDYNTLDEFAYPFRESQGNVFLMGDDHITLGSSSTFTSAARVRGFANYAFEGTSPYIRFAGVALYADNPFEGEGIVVPVIEAYWITGDFDGTELDNALVIMARVEKWSESGDYDWEWSPSAPGGGGAVLTGLDPSTAVVDLKLAVTNGGQTVTFYYRTNSSSGLDAGSWLTATTHTLPVGTGTMEGAPTTTPNVGLGTGFNRAAPGYRLYNKLNGKHFFTIDRAEKNHALATWPWVFADEGIKYYTYAEDSQPGTVPVYRFWSATLGAHFYTINESEKNHLVNDAPVKFFWTLEGPAFYAWPEGSQPPGAKAVYRFWSDSIGSHVYTSSTSERDKLLATPASWFWAYEGVAFYTLSSLFGQ